MTGCRGERLRAMLVAVALVVPLSLVGCATTAVGASAGASPGAGVPSAGAAGAGVPAPSTSPTAACPLIEGVEPPPDCVPYDPDHAMAQNDVYRQRMDLSDGEREAAERAIAEVSPALDALRAGNGVTADAVEAALEDAGLADAQARGDERVVAFAAYGPEGGCVFGEVSAEALRIEAGGYIMDGGCLPAQ
ncbi:hypothetical protein [Microbacterium sp.]|uniref:hypothetical protein n=1 Tax=Microbacterium sp. TaxID=51671 RepID=UPI0039E6A5F6